MAPTDRTPDRAEDAAPAAVEGTVPGAAPAAPVEPAEPAEPVQPAKPAEPAGGRPFLTGRRQPRRQAESVFVRLVSTAGIVGVSVAIAAILGTQDVAAWIIGLVVSLLSVVLAAVLWSSRTL
jgi:hypothetical protein